MAADRIIPDDPLQFIQECVRQRRVLWTYHVNMRMSKRFIPRRVIFESVRTYQIIESYPEDKYLPSYLVWFRYEEAVYHAVFAADVAGQDVRVVTAYRPNPEQWTDDFKRRKRS